MASYSQKTIFIALILAMAAPISTSHRRRWRRSDREWNSEQYLRDLCSETDRSDVCWNILRSELHRFDDGDIAAGVIDLAVAKSKAIGDQLNQWYRDSNDDRMKNKYHSCSKNYDDVDRNLEQAQRNLDSDDNRRISDQIDDAEEELEECRREFGSGSFDPGHVEDRNNELRLYLDMVRVAVNRLEDYYDSDRH
ncbi:pectinesterase inhibitor-like [Salvia miltiorrhiza]|uniref:pectinesterase inhibitor-like n=1 Tax=Salvia miltiorrhiza TaxID=226208 RepID=UPI0025AD79C8|nr:pectinesterase inhibitor-like [Salvia miltiorrhiza]